MPQTQAEMEDYYDEWLQEQLDDDADSDPDAEEQILLRVYERDSIAAALHERERLAHRPLRQVVNVATPATPHSMVTPETTPRRTVSWSVPENTSSSMVRLPGPVEPLPESRIHVAPPAPPIPRTMARRNVDTPMSPPMRTGPPSEPLTPTRAQARARAFSSSRTGATITRLYAAQQGPAASMSSMSTA